MVILTDFDGTITKEKCFPEVGELRKDVARVIKNLQVHGHQVYLWTCREGEYLEDAKRFLESKGIFLDGYNVSPYDHINKGRKPIADLYIDDRNVFCRDVDWRRIETFVLSEQQDKTDQIEKLRKDFRENAGSLCRQIFELKEYGLRFVFNKLSFNKIGCIKSVQNSVNNGFTPEEHFEAAENIKGLFKNAKMISNDYRKNKYDRVNRLSLLVCKITDNVFAYMNVTTWEKDEGYIDLYLSKEGE